MITIVGDELPDLAVIGNITLPGTGQQELGTGIWILFKHQNPAAISSSMDRTEEPGRPGPDDHNVRLHLIPLLQINAGALLMNYSPGMMSGATGGIIPRLSEKSDRAVGDRESLP